MHGRVDHSQSIWDDLKTIAFHRSRDTVPNQQDRPDIIEAATSKKNDLAFGAKNTGIGNAKTDDLKRFLEKIVADVGSRKDHDQLGKHVIFALSLNWRNISTIEKPLTPQPDRIARLRSL